MFLFHMLLEVAGNSNTFLKIPLKAEYPQTFDRQHKAKAIIYNQVI